MSIIHPPPCAKIKRHEHLILEEASSVLLCSSPSTKDMGMVLVRCILFSKVGVEGRMEEHGQRGEAGG